MKTKVIVSLMIFSFFVLCSFNIKKNVKNDTEKAAVEWTSITYNFGKIEKNKPVTASFELKNTSMVPLVINSVKASCGCTVADYPKKPLMPGEVSYIKVTYNTKNVGIFSKSITVNTNTAETVTTLFIKGEVTET